MIFLSFSFFFLFPNEHSYRTSKKCFHYNISNRKSMKITIFLLILVAACTQTCSKGGLRSDNSDCYYPSYLEGCLTYSIDNSCAACEYSTIYFIQITSSPTEDAFTHPTCKASTAANSSTAPVPVSPAQEDYTLTLRLAFARTGK